MPILTTADRVLILRSGALGDLVYATAVIDALRMQYGETITIDFITTPGSGKLFEHDPRINRIFPLKHKKLPILLSSQKKAIIKHSYAYPYNLTIVLDYDKHFKKLITKVKSEYIIGMGYDTKEFPQHLNRSEALKQFYNDIIDPKILSIAKPKVYGVSLEVWRVKCNLPSEYIVIAPSNSHNQKKGINYRAWPFEHWRSLIASLSEKTSVIIVGARGEDLFFNQIKPYFPNVIDLVGQLSIPELITTVQNAKGLVCTDSATGHIGAAVDTPTFVLMGPNDPITDSPYQSDTNSVYPISLQLSCSPCYKTDTMKRCKHNICMSQITPKMVLDKIKNLD